MGRKLKPEEKELWQRVADTAIPRKPPKTDFSELIDTTPVTHPPKTERVHAPLQPFEVGSRAKGQAAVPHHPGKALNMDRKSYARMTSGKLKPEARIDLHGMTLDEAQPELMRFVMRAHASGQRLILVITGKGKERDDGGPIPVRRGILRRHLPIWVAQAPLNSIVLELTEAHLRHGGGGAFYLYLRRPGKTLR